MAIKKNNQVQINIGLIEDDKVITALIRETFLRNVNNIFRSYPTAEQCLKRLVDFKPHVLIIDNDLGGGLTGIQFIKKLKKNKSKAKIIFYTSNSDKALLNEARDLGAFECVVKGEDTSLFYLKNAVKHIRKIERVAQEKRKSRNMMIILALVFAFILTVALILGE